MIIDRTENVDAPAPTAPAAAPAAFREVNLRHFYVCWLSERLDQEVSTLVGGPRRTMEGLPCFPSLERHACFPSLEGSSLLLLNGGTCLLPFNGRTQPAFLQWRDMPASHQRKNPPTSLHRQHEN